MFGLILAMLYTAFAMVTKGMTMEAAFASTTGFLWVWHVVFACIFGGILVIAFFVLLGMVIFGGTEIKALGALGGAAWLIFLLLGAIGAALFLGGVYCVDASIATCPETGEVLPFAQWNMQLFVMGCILYGIGVLKQVCSRFTGSTNNSSKD